MALVATVAMATGPAKNGEIALTRYVDDSRRAGAVFAITADGRPTRRLTRPPRGSIDQHPDWSRDGSRLTFERCENAFTSVEQCAVGIVGATGGRVRVLKPRCGRPQRTALCPIVRGPAFTRQGEIVVGLGWGDRIFQPAGVTCACVDNEVEHWEIVVMNSDGTNVRKILGLDRWVGALNRPQVSPDGKQLVVERRNSWRSRPAGASALFVLNLDGTGLRRITPWKLAAGDGPDWSPDGQRILFRAPRLTGFAGSNLYSIRVDGTEVRQITHFAKRVEVLSASYSPDGNWIVFSRSGRGRLPDIFIVRPDGSGLRQITRTTLWESAPDWGPRTR